MTNHAVLQSNIDHAEAEAARGCGLSDVLYAERVQDAYADILDQAPPSEKEEVLNVLKGRGFDPNFKKYEPEEGECSLTGIPENCCPCGRHP
jgi:hypothetical protein